MNKQRSNYKKRKYCEARKKKRFDYREEKEKMEKIEEIYEENREMRKRFNFLEEENMLLKEKNQLLEMENERLRKKEPFIERFKEFKETKELKKLCGLEFNEFLEVGEKIKIEMYLKTMRNKKRKNKSFKKGKFDNETMLFITLLWLKHYPKNSLFSFFTGISSFHISLIIKKTLKCLKKALSPLVKCPTELEFLGYLDKFKDFVFKEIEGVVCVIYGTEIKVPKPRDKNQQKILWCRKKFFSINFQVIVLLNGEIIYISNYKKSNSDQGHWNNLGLRTLFVGKKFGIMGDSGYKFNKKKEK